MNLLEFNDKLYWNNVPDHWYSLDEGLKPDAYILYKNYSKWEFFYLDEKVERRDYRIFNTDEEAYEHLMLAGYPLRFDMAWPGSFDKKPVWYFSLSLK